MKYKVNVLSILSCSCFTKHSIINTDSDHDLVYCHPHTFHYLITGQFISPSTSVVHTCSYIPGCDINILSPLVLNIFTSAEPCTFPVTVLIICFSYHVDPYNKHFDIGIALYLIKYMMVIQVYILPCTGYGSITVQWFSCCVYVYVCVHVYMCAHASTPHQLQGYALSQIHIILCKCIQLY